ncbi:energy transducer TonB [Winogradskyella sediminis]|uniref:energy transducer TonB n=1 Tax=Winogradskyella sediminis TaxID=1382466 RepID=UPI003AA826BE
MKTSNKDFNIAGQSATEVKRSQKHDANLQKNSSLYFQIGLILCLLGAYALFEMKFEEKTFAPITETASSEPISIEYVEPFTVEVVKPKTAEPLPSVDLIDKYNTVEDDVPLIETIIKTPEEPIISDEPIIDVEHFNTAVDEPQEDIFIPISVIEMVPVYPGCEKKKNNNERKKCMSDKISKLIGKTFNTDIGSNYGISGRQKISTQFTIDKYGNVTDIKTRGPHPALEKEAYRVINKIPKMQPGLQRHVPVGVIYTLPIVFDVRN